jgi:hypothetical protein
MRKAALAATLLTLTLPALVLPAAADEISDALAQASEAYAAGDLATAKRQTDAAAVLLAQKAAERLAEVFPEPLEGWTAAEATTDGMSAAMFGGGIMAGRTYTDGEGNTVQIDVTGDSPMLMSLAGFFASPDMAAALGEPATIAGRQAIVTSEGEIQMMIAERFLIAITGSAPVEAKKAYGEAFDFGKLPG